MTRNPTGWIGATVAGGSTGALDPLLAAVLDEDADVPEVDELRLVERRLGTDRQRSADLRDDDADLARRNLHHRMARHRVDRPQLEPQAGHQEDSLIPGLAGERDRVALVQLFQAETFADKTDFGGTDGPQRTPQGICRQGRHRDGDPGARAQHTKGVHGIWSFIGRQNERPLVQRSRGAVEALDWN